MWLGICGPPSPAAPPPLTLTHLTHKGMISHLTESVLSHINQRPVLSHKILQVMILHEYVFISLSETHENIMFSRPSSGQVWMYLLIYQSMFPYNLGNIFSFLHYTSGIITH